MFAGFVVALTGELRAGTLELAPKETAAPTITESEPWHLTIASPGWLSAFNGTIGINGVDANIDVPFSNILQHLDMVFSTRAELSKGRLGIYSEFFYVGLSAGATVNGLIQSAHDVTNQYYIDAGLSWKLINDPRGSLAVAAGTHYFNVYEQLTLHGNPVQTHDASETFVAHISDDLEARLNNDISHQEFIAELKSTIATDIVSRIDPGGRFDRHQRHPDIPIGPLGGRIRQEIDRIAQDFMHLKLAALQARVDALHLEGDARRAAVHRIVTAAQMQIANDLAYTLQTKVNQTISRQDDWFAPYLGLYGRYNFNKTFYTGVRGQIGGFGVGADLMWQVEGVLGVNVTRQIFTELGYRALGTNYSDNNFSFDAIVHGPQITTGITF